ncbi:hypothetical protein A3C89_00445 [Candidatus Kaiserbacteria bacterium RIFCSPHIGHO2_02_FULL_50_50]|uniref:Uncharacterized protein n=1 Tax=Candidatus Kaiserbacteria bacterium RIFCSPHIGHO2_02_FULL_50_50 TaxID=1798492 RepID=A0A1F6DE16_9BACT|nr:MAG: hypothetical protein A3C89_00445 [Candidatus Kaiserbacteria bacterium RIFCSPHIGHO2_02_FULL_50_50]OGG89211.1 MAG: hypothetical protein A3G62_01125 [Candidatus Kaiserbacteria bacterium RIFCSPLOWO2_12_FULL_50_10]
MTNTLLGLSASVYQLGEMVAILAQLQLLWGFLAGFGLAVLMYSFMATMPERTVRAPGARSKASAIALACVALFCLAFTVLAIISTVRF